MLACSQDAARPGGLQNIGNGSPAGGGGGGGNGQDASILPDSATAETCNAPEVLSVGVCQIGKPSAPPTPLGGTIAAGTYGITAVNVYGVADAGVLQNVCDIRYKIIVSGNTLAIAYELGQQELLQTAEGTFSTSGNVFTETFTCQSFNGAAVTPQTAFAAYTAQAGELRLYGAPFVTSLASLSLGTEYVFELQ